MQIGTQYIDYLQTIEQQLFFNPYVIYDDWLKLLESTIKTFSQSEDLQYLYDEFKIAIQKTKKKFLQSGDPQFKEIGQQIYQKLDKLMSEKYPLIVSQQTVEDLQFLQMLQPTISETVKDAFMAYNIFSQAKDMPTQSTQLKQSDLIDLVIEYN